MQSGLLWMSWEEGKHYNSPWFSLPRHKERASRNVSKEKSRNRAVIYLWVCIISLSVTSKASFLCAWKYLATLYSSIPLYQFFSKKQSQEGTVTKAAYLQPGLVPSDRAGTCFLSYICTSLCIAPFLQKAVTLVIDFLCSSSSPNAVIVEIADSLKGYKISS